MEQSNTNTTTTPATKKFSFSWSSFKNILLFVLIVLVIYFMATCSKHQGEIKELKRVEELQKQEVEHYKDQADRDHATVQVISSSAAVIEKAFSRKLDSVAEVYDIKKKNIQEYIEVAFKAHGSGTGAITKPTEPTVVHDTIDGVVRIDTVDSKLDLDDGFLTLHADIYKTGKYGYDYFYSDSLMAVKRVEKYGFLKLRKRTIFDLAFTNKNAYIIGLQQFEKESPLEHKRFGIGPFVGYGWLGNKFGISVGIGLTYNLIRF